MNHVNSIIVLLDLDDRLRTVFCAFDDPTRKEQFNNELQDHLLHKTMNVKMHGEFPMFSSNILVMHLMCFIEQAIREDLGMEVSDCIKTITLRSSIQVEVILDGRQYRKPSLSRIAHTPTRF